jgi:hypothetical protein
MNSCDHVAHHLGRWKNLDCAVNKDRMNEVRGSRERNSMRNGKRGRLMNEESVYTPVRIQTRIP